MRKHCFQRHYNDYCLRSGLCGKIGHHCLFRTDNNVSNYTGRAVAHKTNGDGAPSPVSVPMITNDDVYSARCLSRAEPVPVAGHSAESLQCEAICLARVSAHRCAGVLDASFAPTWSPHRTPCTNDANALLERRFT